MVKNFGQFLLSVLFGLVPLGVAISASIQGKDSYTIPTLAVILLSIGMLLTMRFPESKWVIAGGASLPLVCFIVWGTDPETRFLAYGVAVGFVTLAVAGAGVGSVLSRKSAGIRRWTGIGVTAAAVFIMALMGYLANQPQPLAGDKLAYVGQWKSEHGIGLNIVSSGFCTFVLEKDALESELAGIDCRDFAHTGEQLQIRIGETDMRFIQSMNLAFDVTIDRAPFEDTSGTCMILKGKRFTRIT